MRVAVVACSPIARDSRVLKTVATLAKAGNDVSVVGYGDVPAGLEAHFISIPEPRPTTSHRLNTALVRLPANIAPGAALALYSRTAEHGRLLMALRAIKPDIVHANDWPTLPAAIVYKREAGCAVLYDSHEFAQAEHEERLYWRVVSQQFVRAVERSYVGEADAVSTVSGSIADALRESYALRGRPTVIANYPRYEVHSPKPTREVLHLLFHGLLTHSRGIELLIAATLLMRRPIVLTLRGSGRHGYIDGLRKLAASGGERIHFEPPVAPAMVVSAATAADIGLFLPILGQAHLDFSMPNKLFEYIMAGLAVVTGYGKEMKQLVERTGCGFPTAAVTAADLAAHVDRLTNVEIDAAKKASAAVAYTLSWDAQEPVLLSVYEDLGRRAAGGRGRRQSA